MVQPSCSVPFSHEMQGLLVEYGILHYKYLFEGILFTMEYNRDTGTCGLLKHSYTIEPLHHGLIPKEDQEKIDNFLDRVSSVLRQCCLKNQTPSMSGLKIDWPA